MSQLLKLLSHVQLLYSKWMIFFLLFRPLFTEVQLINPSRAALVPVLPLSPENSQNNISNAPHPADIHPAYRIPYMQLLHTLHSATSPQSSLHGKYFELLAHCIVDNFPCNKTFCHQERISRRKISPTRVPWVFHMRWTISPATTSTWSA